MILNKRTQAWLDKVKKTSLSYEVGLFLIGKPVEVGYRATCGSTDQTLKDYQIFKKFIKALKAQKIKVSESAVKHNNGYATNNGGFWNSYIFQIES